MQKLLDKLSENRGRITGDKTPLPPKAATPEEDEALLEPYPWVESPVRMDNGYNVKYVSCRPPVR